jgi:ribosomal protein S18 acetylase RimI-like enzyme
MSHGRFVMCVLIVTASLEPELRNLTPDRGPRPGSLPGRADRAASYCSAVPAILTTIALGAAREAWVPLLELADEPEPLRRCLHDGVLYGVVDEQSDAPLGAVLVTDVDEGTAELRVVAVREAAQGRGLGSWMVTEVCNRLRADGKGIVVGTASSGVRQLAFYQRLGFRMTRIDREYFTSARGYPPGLEENGIPTRDMVWFSWSPPS